MSLPLAPPIKPQLALSRKELPVGDDYVYEVKLDGFRCLAFVDAEFRVIAVVRVHLLMHGQRQLQHFGAHRLQSCFCICEDLFWSDISFHYQLEFLIVEFLS